MRTTSLFGVCAVLCMARVYAIHSDKHSSVLIEEHQQMSVDADINLQIRTAQEQVLESVTAGVVVTDGQIDEAVKAAFSPIFTKCEAITNIKAQKRCLLNAAAGKKVTSKGAAKKAAKKAKKAAKKAAKKVAEKKAANKTAAKLLAPKKAAPVVVKDKVANDAKLVKKHLDKAAALQKKVEAEKKKAAGFQAKLVKDAKKVADKAKKAVAKANKQAKKVEKKTAGNKTNKTAVAPVAPKKAAFLEFEAEMAEADELHAETMDAARENIAAFLEVSEAVSPHVDTADHLESIEVSLIDLQELDIPEVSAEEVDAVLKAVQEVTSSDPASFVEQEVEQAPVAVAAEEEHVVASKPQAKIAVTDEERAHEGEASLIAAAEAEMNHDLANFGHTVKKDVVDLSDLEDIDNLNI